MDDDDEDDSLKQAASEREQQEENKKNLFLYEVRKLLRLSAFRKFLAPLMVLMIRIENSTGTGEFFEMQLLLSSYSIILKFLPEKKDILYHPVTKQEFQNATFSLNRYSSYSCNQIILKVLPEKLGIYCHPKGKLEFVL